MLAQTHRFHGYNSLKSVYRQGKTIRRPLLSLKYAGRDPRRPYRVAVVVSRKVNKSAIVRNRIRRRVYEAVRRSEVEIPSGLDLIFSVFTDTLASLEASKLQKTVSELLQKAIQPPTNTSTTPVKHAIVRQAKSEGK